MSKKRIITALLLLGASMSALATDLDTQRIASVDANATEILIGFGLEKNLVAVDITSQAMIQNTEVSNLGYHRALSAEGLLSTEPSLIIGSHHMGPKSIVDTLKTTNIPVLQLPPAATVQELMQNIERLGRDLDSVSRADALIARVQKQSTTIDELQGEQTLRMVFLLNMTGRGLSKAGQGTTGEALVNILGGENLSNYGGYQSIAMEALLELDPDVILVGNSEPGTDAAAMLVQAHPLLVHSRAAKNKRLLTVDAGKMVAGVSLGVMTEAERLSGLIF